MVILFTSFTSLSFAQGGGGAGGDGAGGEGVGGAGAGAGGEGAAGGAMGNSANSTNDQGKSAMNHGKSNQSNIEAIINFFKNLDNFQISEAEEKGLIENSWGD